jgi:hypothetical protein
MKSIRTLAILAAVCALALVSSGAWAQPEWTEETKITFSTPVQVPGMVLPPGTYTFRLANPDSGRNIVEIFDAPGRRLITSKVVIPKQRLEPTGDLFLELAESSDGAPSALVSYFYPGKTSGHEFVYGKDEARSLAARTRHDILAGDLDARDKGSWKEGSVTRVKPDGTQETGTCDHSARTLPAPPPPSRGPRLGPRTFAKPARGSRLPAPAKGAPCCVARRARRPRNSSAPSSSSSSEVRWWPRWS